MVALNDIFDCAIVGSGPAAYTAALKLKKQKTILFEGSYKGSMMPGGQLMTTTDVDNFPGFPNGVNGPELMKILKSQANTTTISQFVTNIEKEVLEENNDAKAMIIFRVFTEKETYLARTVILATGALARRIYVPGTNDGEFWQKGISSCAVCDGWAFRNKDVIVIGGGDTAMEEAKHLSGIARKVYLVHRQKKFKARQDMLANVKSKSNVEILYPYVLQSVTGTTKLENALFKNPETNEMLNLKVDGLFFGIGHDPNSSFIVDLVSKDSEGYVIANEYGHTNCDGIFACGDIQDKKYRQAVYAAKSGCLAAIKVIKYLQG